MFLVNNLGKEAIPIFLVRLTRSLKNLGPATWLVLCGEFFDLLFCHLDNLGMLG